MWAIFDRNDPDWMLSTHWLPEGDDCHVIRVQFADIRGNWIIGEFTPSRSFDW